MSPVATYNSEATIINMAYNKTKSEVKNFDEVSVDNGKNVKTSGSYDANYSQLFRRW